MIRSVLKTTVSAPADLRRGAGYLSSIACGGTLGTRGFFLACDGELSFVGYKPTSVRPKARVTF